MAPRGQKMKQGNERIAELEAALDATLADWKKMKARLDGVEAALKERGLYAFEHVDGSFSLNPL